jgi:hypothetical protein
MIIDLENKNIIVDESVSIQDIYSECKKYWSENPEYYKYPFPFIEKSGGWKLNDKVTVFNLGIIPLGILE